MGGWPWAETQTHEFAPYLPENAGEANGPAGHGPAPGGTPFCYIKGRIS